MKNALISVSDKRGIEDFAKQLVKMGIRIFSTGGTADKLREASVPVTEVADYTGFPEIMNGRVKTLHPKVHGGILAIRSNAEHLAVMAEHGIVPFDLVVVNLYPFEQTISREGVTREEAIEQIDIGGPAMLRSAAKNHKSVTAIVSPDHYGLVLSELRAHNHVLTSTRNYLAADVFFYTAKYDQAIAEYLWRSKDACLGH